jgi:hypothetical protein
MSMTTKILIAALIVSWIIGAWALIRLTRLENILAGRGGFRINKGRRVFVLPGKGRGERRQDVG